MRKQLAPCLVSAALGAGLLWLFENMPAPLGAVAQERSGASPDPRRAFTGPNFPSQEFPGQALTSVPPNTPAAQQAGVDLSLTPEELVNVAVYENVNRSVVNINTTTVRNDSFFLFEVPAEGAGSGSVLDKSGHILTNYHVVDGAREIKVTLFDGKSYEAALVGKDETNDLAVIRIDAPPGSLFPVALGDSTRLKVGQKVFAIGNPFGLQRTLTTGIISSLDRSLPARHHRTIKSIIQIDAAINPGNSGGPLLDSHSRLIGMNTAIASSTGQSAGVGFAIPVGIIGRVVPQLIERGHVIRPDAGIAQVLQTDQGLLVATMVPGGPAEKAGLRGFRVVKHRKKQGPFTYDTQSIDRNAADLITAVDGQPITTASDFLSIVEAKQPGQEAIFTIIRDGRELRVPVRLAAGET